MKVFSLLSLIRNLIVSIKDEDNDNTHFLYWYGLCAMPIMGVGSCNRLFVLGFVRTSYQINETSSTLSFYTNPTIEERMVICYLTKQLYYEETIDVVTNGNCASNITKLRR